MKQMPARRAGRRRYSSQGTRDELLINNMAFLLVRLSADAHSCRGSHEVVHGLLRSHRHGVDGADAPSAGWFPLQGVAMAGGGSGEVGGVKCQ